MEALLFLLPLGLLAAFAGGGGGSDDEDREPEPEPEAPTEENDIVEGDSSPEELLGLGGNDLILGAEGADSLRGGAGGDILVGESGNDELSGQADGDLLIGGAGNDTLGGGDGNDSLISGPGSDRLFGGVGSDELFSISGADSLFGGADEDLIIGLDARDAADAEALVSRVGDLLPSALDSNFGAAGSAELARVQDSLTLATTNRAADVLDGGDGDDVLVGDLGDTMTGGLGTDEFEVYVESGAAPVTVTDFDTAAETMFVLVENLTTQVLSLTDGAGGAEVRVDGTVVAVLQGILAANVDPASVILEAVT